MDNSKKRIIRVLIILYLIYVLLFAIFPYTHTPSFDNPHPLSSHSNAHVALVESPEDGLSSRLALINSAKESLDISYYAIHMGESTDLFLSAIIDAADRDVKVRLLLDGYFGGLTFKHPIYARAIASHENIELALYNRVNILLPWTINGRLHDKYIIADKKTMMLGGRNIGPKYFDSGYNGKISYDRDILVFSSEEDGIIKELENYMNSILKSNLVSYPYERPGYLSKRKQEELRDIEISYTDINKYREKAILADGISLVNNGFDIKKKAPIVSQAIWSIMLGAKESVLIQSPYIIMDKRLNNHLKALGKSDVEKIILTNSISSSANPIAYSSYRATRWRMLRYKIPLYEYYGQNSIHAKSYIIDDYISIVGSFNLDPRSAYIDTELMLVIESGEFAKELRKTIEDEYLSKSVLVNSSLDDPRDIVIEKRDAPLIKKAIIIAIMSLSYLFRFLA